jgi:alpha-tubulin suppressor-like RCC1 family protein
MCSIYRSNNHVRVGLVLIFLLVWLLSPPTVQGAAPDGYSQPASRITETNATLHGSVVPNGTTTQAWFEWGTNSSFNRMTISTNVGNGSALVYVSLAVTGLVAHQEYRYRLVTSNALGVVRGRVIQFATGFEISGWGTDSYGEIAKTHTITNVTALAHGLALKTDGTIAAWAGADYSGQTNVPPGLSNILTVATGPGYSLALRSNGTVIAWGENDFNQTNVPASLSNVVALNTGWYGHSFALKSDGRAVGWGYNTFGQANVPSICTNLIQIVGGALSSMALRADNTIILWGDNAYGELNAPDNMTNVVALAMGYGHSLALQADGKVHAWGWNSDGQTNVPPDVTNAIAIAAGNSSSFAILADGTLRAWGDNFYKQTTISPALRGVVAVAGQNQTSYALCKTALGRPLTGTIAYSRQPQPVRGNSAVLTGFVATDGHETAAWFEWGTDSNYGQTTTATNLGTSTNLIHVTTAISDLTFGGVYHCRLVASNESGVVYGQNQRFTTSALIGKWGVAGEFSVPGAQAGFVAVDTGETHDLALRADGGILAWGDNSFGKIAVPAGLTNNSAITASRYSSLAVTDDGTMRTWGNSPSPAGWSNVISLQTGPYYSTAALFADGRLTVGTGYTNFNVVKIEGNSSYGIGLKIDGKAFVWGTGNNSQDVPFDLGHVTDVACGTSHRLALLADGTVLGWGANDSGQLNIPPGLTNVIAISANQYHSVALKSDGTVVSWGSGAHPNFPPNLTNAFAIAAGPNYNLYLYQTTPAPALGHTHLPAPLTTTNATLRGSVVPNGFPTTVWFEWGPTPSYGNTTKPKYVGSWLGTHLITEPISNLLASTTYHCRLVATNSAGLTYGPDQVFRTGSKVSVWGYNDYAQATLPAGLRTVIDVAAGLNFGCALKTDGSVVAWGDNTYGQASVPANLSNVIALAGGTWHTLALKRDGTVSAWGLNTYSQCNVPAGLTDVIAVSAGDIHSLALRADGTVIAWGSNQDGQTNQAAGLFNIVAIAAGGAHSLALRADGTIIGWGANYQGQLNIPPGTTNVIAVAAGSGHGLALRADGTVTAWGYNAENQTNVPAGLTNVARIATGWAHSIAIRTNGSIAIWGRNNFGQTTAPTDLESCFGADGGYDHVIALANLPPVAMSQTIPVAFNQDTTLQLVASDRNLDQLSYTITSLPAAGSLFQLTPSGRGAAITSPGTTVEDALGRILFAAETNAVGSPYASFHFTAHDGDSASAPALLTLDLQIQKPYAIAQPTTPLGATGVTFHGVVTPNNSPTTAWFEWGETSGYGQNSVPVEVGDTANPVRLSIPVTTLAASANYHGRLVASNQIGINFGTDFIFTTGEKVTVQASAGNALLKFPAGLSNTVALALGNNHAVALNANGAVTAWGAGQQSDQRARHSQQRHRPQRAGLSYPGTPRGRNGRWLGGGPQWPSHAAGWLEQCDRHRSGTFQTALL